MVLNMISTATMIQLKVKGIRWSTCIEQQQTGWPRSKMIMKKFVTYEEAAKLLNTHGSVRKAVDSYNSKQ
jgi:N-acetylmuramic acid 6-phosphate etherase